MMQNGRRADDGVACKCQFLEEVEYACANQARITRRLEEYRLEVAKFLGYLQHLPRR